MSQTFGEAAEAFMRSPRYRALKPATKKIYERARNNLHTISPLHTSFNVAFLRGAMEHLEDRPGIYNQARSFGSAVCEWNGWSLNSFKKLDPMKLGRHRAWTDREVMAFRNLDQMLIKYDQAYILFELALCTGQRFGDLAGLTVGDFSDEYRWLDLSQEKTGESVSIPIPEKVASLLKGPPEGALDHIFAFGQSHLRRSFRSRMRDAGIKGKTFHGLRMTAARRMAEAGCTEREIMAYTGHKTSSMVGHYVRDASRAKLAVNAMKKMEEATWL